jgi:Tol biopolymer transport system component/predicted Ser/Thr protein kinase
MATGPRDDAGTLTTSYQGAESRIRQPPEAARSPGRSALGPGAQIGRYVVEEPLGQGGMGAVVAARDPELARQVALKVVRPGVGDRPYRRRLVREARAMAQLEHVNVVRVYDAGEVDGEVFVAMELVRGETLGQWLRAARRPWREVVTRFIAAGRGLAAAHRAGLVHRDFKPDNVLVRASDGRVCVTDFGLAVPIAEPERGRGGERGQGGESGEGRGGNDVPTASGEPASAAARPIETTLTRTGAAVGTPAYMAPEQRRGEEVDARADIFSFCVSLHEGLYGVRPFDADPAGAPTAAGSPSTRDRTRSPPRAPGVPGAVRRAIRRGLMLDPAARWPAIDPVLAILERALRRRRVAIAGIAAVAAAAVAIAAAVMADRSDEPAGSTPAAASFAYDRAQRVTFAPGCEAQPAFLPDGRLVYVQRSGMSTTLRVTGDGDPVGKALGAGASPAVSPSGRYLATLERANVMIRDLQHPSELPRQLGTSTGAVAWLGDREIIAGVGNTVVARPLSIDGSGDDRVLAHLPQGNSLRAAAVGADGRIFAIHRADVVIAESFVVEIPQRGPAEGARELRRGVLAQPGLRYRPASKTIYFVQRMNSTQYHLFRQPADGIVEPTALISDLPPTGGFDIALDGSRLVFSTCAETAALVKLPVSGPPVELTRRGGWRDSSPAVVDRDRFVFSSTRGGEMQVWLHDASAGDDRPLTKPESNYPALSPDRKTLVYAALSERALVLRPLDADAPARTLTTGHVDRDPRFTRDGATVVFLRETSAGLRLFRVAASGGPASEVILDEVRLFDLSPIDDSIVFVTPGRDRDRLRRVALGSTDARDVAGADALAPKPRFVRFAPGGAALVVVDRDGISELDLATGHVRSRFRLDGSPYSSVGPLDFDADGALVASLIASDGDLWIAEGRF